MSHAKKSLGQHFLTDQHAIARIVDAVPSGVTALEIGPGRGAITTPLRQRCSQLTVIEKDHNLAAHWQQQGEHDATFGIIHGDVMDLLTTTVRDTQPAWIVGNLPYNISGPLTAQLAALDGISGMVLMYQREVAERIAAAPGTGRVCGGISVITCFYWNIVRICTLPPGAFSPPPKVHSVVLQFSRNPRSADPAGFARLQKCVRTGFAHRRKTIHNNFRPQMNPERWQLCGIDPGLRPEALSLEQWIALAKALPHH
ncbi:MAG: 16S rRNA (adenine(1518)-N(6)/adenine(1519)-N(6))-dimethyltransferase RsmA [Mariprofundales bacterium]|nr:16S rRNA (adenine(1518)-N(6)/adenine(1519)-N(6))-dimethyltransferase RsmA [Mariprofundales bacterium]